MKNEKLGTLTGLSNRCTNFIEIMAKEFANLGTIKRIFFKRNKRLEDLLMKRPFSLNIETTNICNARCCFCPYPKSRRKKEEMDIGLYEKIVREFSEMGGGSLDFSPIVGDFFLDSRCLERIEIARKYPNIGSICAVTNGIALNRIKDDWEYFLKHTDVLHFSVGGLSGLSREAYREMYGVDKYEKVRSNIIDFARLRNRVRPDYPIGLLLRVSSKSEVFKSPDFKEFKNLGVDIFVDNVYGNWGGMITKEDLPEGTIFKRNPSTAEKSNPCFVFYIGMGITSSGLGVACSCMNAEVAELTVGDCKKEHLKDIWNNEKYRRLKSSFGSERMPEICEKCTYYQDGIRYSLRPNVVNFKEGRYPFGY